MSKKTKKVGVTCQLDPEVFQTLKELSEENDVSLSWLIRAAIKNYLDSLEPSEE